MLHSWHSLLFICFKDKISFLLLPSNCLKWSHMIWGFSYDTQMTYRWWLPLFKPFVMVGSENIYQTKNSPIILQPLWENKVTTAWFQCCKMLFMNCFKRPKMNNKLQKKAVWSNTSIKLSILLHPWLVQVCLYRQSIFHTYYIFLKYHAHFGNI